MCMNTSIVHLPNKRLGVKLNGLLITGLLLSSLLTLTACGGGGSGSGTSVNQPGDNSGSATNQPGDDSGPVLDEGKIKTAREQAEQAVAQVSSAETAAKASHQVAVESAERAAAFSPSNPATQIAFTEASNASNAVSQTQEQKLIAESALQSALVAKSLEDAEKAASQAQIAAQVAQVAQEQAALAAQRAQAAATEVASNEGSKIKAAQVLAEQAVSQASAAETAAIAARQAALRSAQQASAQSSTYSEARPATTKAYAEASSASTAAATASEQKIAAETAWNTALTAQSTQAAEQAAAQAQAAAQSAQTAQVEAEQAAARAEAAHQEAIQLVKEALSKHYVKLDSLGNELPASASSWSCVRDKKTGLVWESKPDDGSVRDRDWRYRHLHNYGGYAGTQDYEGKTMCQGLSSCDPYSYINTVQSQSLCGRTSWRLPLKSELGSIAQINEGGQPPHVDLNFFPDVVNKPYQAAYCTENMNTAVDCGYTDIPVDPNDQSRVECNYQGVDFGLPLQNGIQTQQNLEVSILVPLRYYGEVKDGKPLWPNANWLCYTRLVSSF